MENDIEMPVKKGWLAAWIALTVMSGLMYAGNRHDHPYLMATAAAIGVMGGTSLLCMITPRELVDMRAFLAPFIVGGLWTTAMICFAAAHANEGQGAAGAFIAGIALAVTAGVVALRHNLDERFGNWGLVIPPVLQAVLFLVLMG